MSRRGRVDLARGSAGDLHGEGQVDQGSTLSAPKQWAPLGRERELHIPRLRPDHEEDRGQPAGHMVDTQSRGAPDPVLSIDGPPRRNKGFARGGKGARDHRFGVRRFLSGSRRIPDRGHPGAVGRSGQLRDRASAAPQDGAIRGKRPSPAWSRALHGKGDRDGRSYPGRGQGGRSIRARDPPRSG